MLSTRFQLILGPKSADLRFAVCWSPEYLMQYTVDGTGEGGGGYYNGGFTEKVFRRKGLPNLYLVID